MILRNGSAEGKKCRNKRAEFKIHRVGGKKRKIRMFIQNVRFCLIICHWCFSAVHCWLNRTFKYIIIFVRHWINDISYAKRHFSCFLAILFTPSWAWHSDENFAIDSMCINSIASSFVIVCRTKNSPQCYIY